MLFRSITAIGGSDNHDPTLAPEKAPAIGVPTTVVRSMELGPAAILAAIRAGHVFVDVEGSRDRLLEVTAVLGGARAGMGDAIAAPAGSRGRISVHIQGVEGAVISLAGDGAGLVTLSDPIIRKADDLKTFDLVSDGARHWLRVDVRSTSGRLMLLGNPIYLNPRN